MTAEVSPLSQSTFWSTHMSRWLGAQGEQSLANCDPQSSKDAGDQPPVLAQPPRPIWPRVFPGL